MVPLERLVLEPAPCGRGAELAVLLAECAGRQRPADQEPELRQLRSGPRLEASTTDRRIDTVFRPEQQYKLFRVSERRLTCLGELAPVAPKAGQGVEPGEHGSAVG